MTNQTTALVSRQAAGITPSVPAQALPSLAAGLPEKLQLANAICDAKDLIPKHYQGKPGAVLLAIDWAERHEVSLFEVFGEVSFRNGRSTTSARMQRKLASRKGYITRKIHGDTKSCTVAVIGPDGVEVDGEGNGRFTYTIDLAQSLGLVDNNALYLKDPAQMLFHRATTRALDQYGPAELSNVFVEEYPAEPDRGDITDVLTAAPAVADDGLPAEPEFHISPEEEAAAQGDPLTAPPPEPVTEAQLRKLGTAKVLRAAKDLGRAELALIGDVVKDQDLARRIIGRLT